VLSAGLFHLITDYCRCMVIPTIESVDAWKPKVWPFKWKLMGNVFLYCCLICYYTGCFSKVNVMSGLTRLAAGWLVSPRWLFSPVLHEASHSFSGRAKFRSCHIKKIASPKTASNEFTFIISSFWCIIYCRCVDIWSDKSLYGCYLLVSQTQLHDKLSARRLSGIPASRYCDSS